MALDLTTLLQLLTQFQGGGAPFIHPTSGLEEPSLSGLKLGEQGMGLGGGGSLLGGAPGLGGGAEGSGLDLLTLMNTLTQGAGTISAPSQSLLAGIGGAVEPGVGGGAGPGVGAGGRLLPQQGGVPQGTFGQAAAGGGQSAATVLALLKEAVGLGKTLLRPGEGGIAPGGSLPNIPNVLLGEGLGQSPFFGGGLTPGDVSTLTGTQPFGGTGFTPDEVSLLTGTTPPNLLEGIGTPGQLLSIPGLGDLPAFPAGAAGLPGVGGGTFSGAGNILPGLPSLGAEGATSGADLAAQFGALGGGEFGLGNLAGGEAGNLLSFGNALPGLGVLGNIGSGLLGLGQGNIGAGAGTLGGTAAGLGLGAALAPETFGLSLLLGGLGGSAGGLLGSLFGGLFGSPSVFEARRRNVGPTAQAGESALAGALSKITSGTQSLNDLLAALGVPTPDTFGGSRNPVAVDLRVPVGTTIPGLTGGVEVPGQFTQFSFNPNRATPGRPDSVIGPTGLSAYLNYVTQHPEALGFLLGSGDVAFQDQAAAAAQAARVQADAQNAIRRFLGLPMPVGVPSGPPEPATVADPFGFSFEDRGGS